MALTIIEAATEVRLTTLAAVKAELQVTKNTDDAYLNELIDQASDAVRSWCQRTFAAETVRETIHLSTCTTALMLSRWPITTIFSVEINGEAEDTANVETDEAGFLRRLTDGRLVFWPATRIVIQYRAGYVLPGQSGRTLPKAIERGVILTVKDAWHARERDPRLRSENEDIPGVMSRQAAYHVVRSWSLLPDVEALVSEYRQVAI
jgi:hypothetical protein